MLSKKSKYAIKALFCLAQNYSENSILRISEISEKENIPRKFLETILLELRNKKLENIFVIIRPKLNKTRKFIINSFYLNLF